MFGRLNRLLSATIVAGALCAAVLAGPATASSCGSGSTSAVSVYRECPQSGGGGGKSSSKPSAGTHTSTTSSSGSTQQPQHYTTKTKKALNEAGKDKAALAALVKSSGLNRTLASHAGDVGTPTAVGSAFDLTSGPTALLFVLAGTALLLLGGSGMRVWRARRRV